MRCGADTLARCFWSDPKSVEMSLDAADTSVRATSSDGGK
jgi:hypothetical protein